MIELYDVGRTTHRAVKGMYEFIVNNVDKYISNQDLAEKLREEAKAREVKGHSIPQEYFSLMCQIWTEAYRSGDFEIDLEAAIFPDTIERFRKVKSSGRTIGILTSASRDFTDVLYDLNIGPNQKLSDLVDDYFLGEEIGDKDFPETFAGLWEKTKGGIYAIFDDKPSVCRAAYEGINQAGGKTKLYLIDRKGQYSGEILEEMAEKGVIKIGNFNEVKE
jgi:methionine salvage enolase-phosphatase E1